MIYKKYNEMSKSIYNNSEFFYQFEISVFIRTTYKILSKFIYTKQPISKQVGLSLHLCEIGL